MSFDNTDHFLLSREWRTVRMRVLERDGGKCACCGSTAADGVRMNVDHIKPRIRYPELALTDANLQVLCEACNRGKGSTYETDWRPARLPRTAVRAPHVVDSGPAYECTPEERARLEQLDFIRRVPR